MSFRAALSGINAASQELKVISNNVANASTTGFKQSRAEFADVYASAGAGAAATAIGSGVRLSAVSQQFSQGNIGFTDNKLDMAINGRGFFVLDNNGTRSYTRAGSFQVDREGYMVNSGANRLVVNNADADGNIIVTDLDHGFNLFTPAQLALADINVTSSTAASHPTNSGPWPYGQWNPNHIDINNPVPEPATLGLMAIGGLMMIHRRRVVRHD